MVFSQTVERESHCGGSFGRRDLEFGRLHRGAVIGRFVRRVNIPSLARANHVDGAIASHGHQPRRRRAARAIERRSVTPRAQHRILHDVLGLGASAGDPVCNGHQRGCIAIVQFEQRGSIAACRALENGFGISGVFKRRLGAICRGLVGSSGHVEGAEPRIVGDRPWDVNEAQATAEF